MANCTIFVRCGLPVFYVKPYLQSTKAVIQLSRKKEERGREEIIEKRRKEKKKTRKDNTNRFIHTVAPRGADNKICKFSKYLFLFSFMYVIMI